MQTFNPFDGETAIVSGDTSGIGREIAVNFGRRGLRVVLASRQIADVERAAPGIPGASAAQCHFGFWNREAGRPILHDEDEIVKAIRLNQGGRIDSEPPSAQLAAN